MSSLSATSFIGPLALSSGCARSCNPRNTSGAYPGAGCLHCPHHTMPPFEHHRIAACFSTVRITAGLGDLQLDCVGRVDGSKSSSWLFSAGYAKSNLLTAGGATPRAGSCGPPGPWSAQWGRTRDPGPCPRTPRRVAVPLLGLSGSARCQLCVRTRVRYDIQLARPWHGRVSTTWPTHSATPSTQPLARVANPLMREHGRFMAQRGEGAGGHRGIAGIGPRLVYEANRLLRAVWPLLLLPGCFCSRGRSIVRAKPSVRRAITIFAVTLPSCQRLLSEAKEPISQKHGGELLYVWWRRLCMCVSWVRLDSPYRSNCCSLQLRPDTARCWRGMSRSLPTW